MTTEISTPVGEAAVEALAAVASPWLAARRRAAWDAYSSMPWPSSARDEDWRRTDISKLHPECFDVASERSAATDDVIAMVRAQIEAIDPAAALVICDNTGYFETANVDVLTAQGVVITSLAEAAGRHEEIVARGLGVVPIDDRPLTALWNALWRGGVFIHVPAAVDAAQTVFVVHVVAGGDVASFPATLIDAAASARLSVVELHVSPDGDAALFSNATTAINVSDNAHVEHSLLQRHGLGTWHIGLVRAALGRDAEWQSFTATLGSRTQKLYWEALLAGEGSNAEMHGILLGDGEQLLDVQSLQAHRAGHATSRLDLRVAVRGTSRAVYSGLIDVDAGAADTDAYVKNRSLILSNGAKADSVPRLEIRANDVRCGHGATAGHVDEDQRFYLVARGIAADEADRIIVRGFLDEELRRAPQDEFVTLVDAILDARLGGSSAS